MWSVLAQAPFLISCSNASLFFSNSLKTYCFDINSHLVELAIGDLAEDCLHNLDDSTRIVSQTYGLLIAREVQISPAR